jgi:hypothetical protein
MPINYCRARSASPDVRGARDDGGDRGREGRRTEDRDGDREGRRDRGDRGRRDERGADMNGTRGDRGDAKAKPKAGDEPAPPPRRELTEEQKRMIEELEASKPARKPKMVCACASGCVRHCRLGIWPRFWLVGGQE